MIPSHYIILNVFNWKLWDMQRNNKVWSTHRINSFKELKETMSIEL